MDALLIFYSISTVILNVIGPILFISFCKHCLGIDPQAEIDKFVITIGKTRSGLLVVSCFILIISFSFLAYERWEQMQEREEIQEHLPRDRKSPPRETWITPDLDMTNSIDRLLANPDLSH